MAEKDKYGLTAAEKQKLMDALGRSTDDNQPAPVNSWVIDVVEMLCDLLKIFI